MKEVFKDIEGYESLYAISNLGRVWSYPKKSNANQQGMFLKQSINNKGYVKVELVKNNIYKKESVHRLVAISFIGNIKDKIVHHKDGNKLNNYYKNLEIISKSEHDSLHKINRYKSIKKRIQCVETGIIYESISEANKSIGYHSPGSISECCYEIRKTAANYHWKFV